MDYFLLTKIKKKSIAMTGFCDVGAAMCPALSCLDFFWFCFLIKGLSNLLNIKSDDKIIKQRSTIVEGWLEHQAGEANIIVKENYLVFT